MRLIEIPAIKFKKYVPEQLSECDFLQYIEISALIFKYQIGEITYEQFRILAFYKLLEMKPVNTDKVDIEKQSNLYQFSQFIDLFFEENEAKEKVIKQYYIDNKIPSIRAGIFKHYGPSNEFNNVTFGEYIDGLEAFIDFNQTGEMIYLYRLLAIFYRKPKFFKSSFDIRRTYDANDLEKRTELFKHQYIGIVYGFYLYFASFQKYLTSAKIFVEGNEIDLSILYEQNSDDYKSDIPGIGMKGVLFSMAESGVFGDQTETRNTSLWLVMIKMYDIVKRNADEKAAHKQLNK